MQNGTSYHNWHFTANNFEISPCRLIGSIDRSALINTQNKLANF